MNKKQNQKRIRIVVISFIIIGVLLLGYKSIFQKPNHIELLNLVTVEENNELKEKKEKLVHSSKFAHVSFDDVILMFEDLNQKKDQYTTIFENEILAQLQMLHKMYETVFTCYTYYENNQTKFNLSMCTNQFAKEFQQNASWLKFAFHTKNATTTYENTLPETIQKDYLQTTKELLRITGSKECIDQVIRLQSYQGNEPSIQAIQKGNIAYGILGLLGPDDTRRSYFLDNETTSYLYYYDYFTNANLNYFKTDIRIENIKNLEETWQNIKQSNDTNQILIIFTHEWKLIEPEVLKNLKQLCQKIKEDGYQFDFPMNRLQTIVEE